MLQPLAMLLGKWRNNRFILRAVNISSQSLKKAIENPVVGLITSSDSFISSDGRIAEIKKHFPEVLAVEMEGASIAQAATALKKPFVIIRAMSDTASHDANVKFDEFIIEAGRKSAQTLMNFLNNME
jgi:methylthioadenosine nucleosidase (EC 3.2.2.16)